MHVQGNLTVDGTIFSSGGLLSLSANLTETTFEGDGTASGWSIQNPHAQKVLCTQVTINTTTAPTDGATTVDIDTGTGTFLSGAGSGTGLTDSYTFAAEVHTSSGTTVSDSSGYPSGFVLDEKDGTTDYVLLGSETGTGGGLVADVYIECHSLN